MIGPISGTQNTPLPSVNPLFRNPAATVNNLGPRSRAELIASYVPTYLTIVDSKARAVTVAEAGVRLYIWRDGWGGKTGGTLRPAYVSFGAVAAGERDGALTSPFHGTSRFGGFVGWGDSRFAVIGGRESRVLFTRRVQIVPWLF